MRAAGQTSYVMMRPQEHEMVLPGRVFRWSGYDGGPSVTTFRIAGGYGDFNRISEAHIRASLADLPEGIDHTMCFLGVGDHGGGPNERLMKWLEEHRAALSDVRMIWSSPARFFAAICENLELLPEHTGELQHHAIGCYSVYRPVKVAVRRAEHLLAQAETLATPADRADLDEAWRTTCFHHFHDTLGGTCIPSAYGQVEAQLGGVQALADTLLQTTLRRRVLAMPADPHHRLVVQNASDRPFAGYASWEYWWTDGGKWEEHWRLLDEQGVVVPHQMPATEAVQVGMQSRVLFRTDLGPGETRVIRIDRNTSDDPHLPKSSVTAIGSQIASPLGAAVDLSADASANGLHLAGLPLQLPRLDLIDDPTDTWSHGVTGYAEASANECQWESPTLADRGPLMATLIQRGRIGGSNVLAEYRVFYDEPYVELLLRVEWIERHNVLKLTWPLPAPLVDRTDGILGGELVRPFNGIERPIRDFTLLRLADESRLGVVCPDVYALDANAERIRFTLLRGALMAHHDPATVADNPRGRPTDMGLHEFRFRFYAGRDLTTQLLDEAATAMQRPLLVAETTDGMSAV